MDDLEIDEVPTPSLKDIVNSVITDNERRDCVFEEETIEPEEPKPKRKRKVSNKKLESLEKVRGLRKGVYDKHKENSKIVDKYKEIGVDLNDLFNKLNVVNEEVESPKDEPLSDFEEEVFSDVEEKQYPKSWNSRGNNPFGKSRYVRKF